MANCEEVREHLESCDDCNFYIEVEARLRIQPVLEPPRRLPGRVMDAIPRRVSLFREYARLAAAAVIMAALTTGALLAGLDQHEWALWAKAEGAQMIQSTLSTIEPLRSEIWK